MCDYDIWAFNMEPVSDFLNFSTLTILVKEFPRIHKRFHEKYFFCVVVWYIISIPVVVLCGSTLIHIFSAPFKVSQALRYYAVFKTVARIHAKRCCILGGRLSLILDM